ncbi:protein phosphatase 2C domain-containing protein [Bythopirellula goksoeyrii]|uniref:PPM-type phosphatase domain-containing protein n=1 Tax=Bythopirellula goksoeyrii TaxID=1400387 RepID=A0A5B9QG05_9BACT|nr:protein phosphatase 2C domain-containing protein [Bythopirellula goksoeyrii]QEG37714.1 hypothetical protein Pr1d_50600 [Bythopirellula goksoeyrii]
MIAPPKPADRLSRLLKHYALQFGERLARAGSLYESHGHIECNEFGISTASEAGGRRNNQDASLIWIPQQPSPVRWAAAISDGVRTSIQSEHGSQLACYAALTVLLQSYQQEKEPNAQPIEQCLKYFSKLGTKVGEYADHLRPEMLSKGNWKRVLRDGRFAQTTLMVAWEDDRGLTIEGIGDGGYILNIDGPSLSYLPSSDGPVNCLSPSGVCLRRDFRIEVQHWESLALFTDGVTPAVSMEGLIVPTNAAKEENLASSTLDNYLSVYPHLIDDNVTLLTAARRHQQ